jgi:hypothetical protein
MDDGCKRQCKVITAMDQTLVMLHMVEKPNCYSANMLHWLDNSTYIDSSELCKYMLSIGRSTSNNKFRYCLYVSTFDETLTLLKIIRDYSVCNYFFDCSIPTKMIESSMVCTYIKNKNDIYRGQT